MQRTWLGYFAGWRSEEIEALVEELHCQIGFLNRSGGSYKQIKDLVQEIAGRVFKAIREGYVDCAGSFDSLDRLVIVVSEGRKIVAKDWFLKGPDVTDPRYTDKEVYLIVFGYMLGKTTLPYNASVSEWKSQVQEWLI